MNFPYTLRYSPRAKKIQIRLSLQKGIELIVPLRSKEKTALAFLQEKQAWIEAKWQLLESKKKAPESQDLPTELYLPALEKTFIIHYDRTPLKKNRLTAMIEGNCLRIFINQEDQVHKAQALRHWVEKESAHFLSQRLHYLSQKTGLVYQRVRFGHQKTLWGSCSAKNLISLSYRLIFLPMALVDYVLIHELCHTKEHHHQVAFWRLLAHYLPEYKECIKALKASHTPAWFHPKAGG